MSQLTSFQIVRDHLSLSPNNAHPRLNLGVEAAIGGLAAGAGVIVLAIGLCATTTAAAGLLTATSILTGLTFTMALRFWERSLDARSNPDLVFDERRKLVLDSMRTTLLWTVLSGVISTAWLGALLLAMGAGPALSWATAVGTALVSYQLLCVVRSLITLYGASYTLRP